ncbi:DinB family protein [Ktedonobacter racemifer]|uniref:DinB-like domain-containing protein n=1 Tax=Ktedonobacter racemifer DSM 44963 TaxID=485913 RepID=D6U5P6_KTERA|nr:DinB family protein [Ktedonobacter racemifer]EFH80307.1 hypothetical protein Krac_0896 [Ktedonobacter racemifer DSM 44963]
MAEDNFTLTTYYTIWKEYQEHVKGAIAPLTAEQLALRAAPHLRSVGENAMHIIGTRIGWFIQILGEEFGEEMSAYLKRNEVALRQGAPVPTAAELAQGLDLTWQLIADGLARWSPPDMQQTFPDEWDGKQVYLSRAWVVGHVMEHDMHHGGELSFTLGMHGVPADFPG